ncbi:MAG TPA: DUF4124 domain-containing protein [Leucothrix sp.]|nr:DUF4124 domain-containing protein [Leucothrix sp.]
MRFLRKILIIIGLIPLLLNAEEFYKWTDARGQTHYGEKAPQNQRAKAVEMPAITVLENYGKQWLPLEPLKKVARSKPSPVAVAGVKKIAVASDFQPSYETLKFIAPKAGQVIKAKDGDVSAMLSVKPPLKRGHKIVFLMDGKANSKSKSRIANFTNLTTGTHSLSAKIIDSNGKTQMASGELKFDINR